MRFQGKPNWVCREEEDLQKENDRRIELQIGRPKRYELKDVIEKMRKDYAKYGKGDDDRRLHGLRPDEDSESQDTGRG